MADATPAARPAADTPLAAATDARSAGVSLLTHALPADSTREIGEDAALLEWVVQKLQLVLLGCMLSLGCERLPVPPSSGDAQAAGARDAHVASDVQQSSDAGFAEPVGCTKIDLLFVIDNSASMADEQANLAQNFPKFIALLQQFRDGQVDFRIGVTTTAFPASVLSFQIQSGAQGALLQTSDMPQRWLTSDDPQLTKHFETLATVGTNGAGDEQPLKAARASVVDRVADGTNAGFLRDDALLAMVIITDEDDQSTDGTGPLDPGNPIPISSFLKSFDEVKGGRTHWTAAVIAGPVAPSCTSRFGAAVFAGRLLAFDEAAQGNVVFSSICTGDLSTGLSDALYGFVTACQGYLI
jgi:hypothetical protein